MRRATVGLPDSTPTTRVSKESEIVLRSDRSQAQRLKVITMRGEAARMKRTIFFRPYTQQDAKKPSKYVAIKMRFALMNISSKKKRKIRDKNLHFVFRCLRPKLVYNTAAA